MALIQERARAWLVLMKLFQRTTSDRPRPFPEGKTRVSVSNGEWISNLREMAVEGTKRRKRL